VDFETSKGYVGPVRLAEKTADADADADLL
jgi:hypothetical protein